MEIVFVHLNTPVPKYLRHNLETTISRFPEHQVTLLHNVITNAPQISKLKRYLVNMDSRWKRLDTLYSHPKKFRGNFWLTSSARLFALEDYIDREKVEIIHVESDVILSPDFPFEKFQEMNKSLAFPIISNERGVASVVYVRHGDAARILTSTLIEEATKNSQTTEMLSLRRVYENNSKQIQLLPIGLDDSRIYRNIDLNMIQELRKAHHIFNGTFDGVEIGQYFSGTDPRNRRGQVLIRHDLANGYIDITKLMLEFDVNRNFVNIKSKNEPHITSRLFAIHVPVKQIRFFKAASQGKSLMDISSQSRNGRKQEISFQVAFRSAIASGIRRLKRSLGLG
jgi:hypothetical protein